MKKRFLLLLLALGATGTQAQLQRLAILPQKVTITPSGGHLRSVGVDYDREEPRFDSSKRSYPIYNQFYDVSAISASINGKNYPGGFRALAEGPNPLLLLQARGADDIQVRINVKNPQAKTIKNIRLDATGVSWIGTTPGDSTALTLAKIVLYNYGPYMSQYEFTRRIKSLAILDKNNLMHFSQGMKLDPQSMAVMNRLYGFYVLDVFNGASLKGFLDNNLVVIDQQGLSTAASADFLNHAVAFLQAIEHALVNIRANDTAALLDNQRLIIPQNKLLVDTMINGEQYILCQSWQDSSFFSGIQQGNPLPYLVTDSVFFSPQTALFITLAPDMQLWYDSINGAGLSDQELFYRISDVLGLPPYSKDNLFFEMWARPQDIFRPAPDSSTSIATLTQKSGPVYLGYLANYIRGSYKGPNLLNQYPFAAIGLTYDSSPANPSHIGLSEFVIRQSRKVYIRTVVPTNPYFNRPSGSARR